VKAGPVADRYRSCIDVHLILRAGDRVLLGERRNTGFCDGFFHLPSGHLEDGESAISALVREAEEEIGVVVEPADARFVHLMHHRTNEGRVALFFEVGRWRDEPENREPRKCAGLQWFPIGDLPVRITPYVNDALRNYAAGLGYSERGWSLA
jgi:8-oxo-dGTP pyrophosphatase MutT (NUDIX family)